jgi:DNA-binding response OmpR family regulator
MEQPIRTLIVDDEEHIRFFLSETLRKSGHTIETATSGEQALDKLRDARFDLAILDLRLGGRVDGLRVLEAVRWRWPDTVVIMLTAHGSLESAMSAIREGVDGYLLKPAEPNEVRQAVQDAFARHQRRARPEQESKLLQHGALYIDRDRHLATLEGRPLDLTPSEFKLLAYLAQHAGRVVSPRELVRVVQEYDCDSEQEARDVVKWYVHRLRQKLEPDPSNPRYILNVRGVGYTLGEAA